jgi:hypothetical protein
MRRPDLSSNVVYQSSFHISKCVAATSTNIHTSENNNFSVTKILYFRSNI